MCFLRNYSCCILSRRMTLLKWIFFVLNQASQRVGIEGTEGTARRILNLNTK
jgi:hypothetical protein